MKVSGTIVVVFTVSTVLSFQFGCEQQAIIPEQSQALGKQHESVNVLPEAKNTPTESSRQLQKGLPVIEVEIPVYDFGKVNPDRGYSCEFNFKNIGDGILKIKKIESTCGCTIPKLKKKEYNPGESGLVEVKFHSPESQGVTTKHLYIHSNSKVNPKFELTIRAKVDSDIIAKPNKLKLSLKEDNAGITPIIITSKNGKPFSIKSFAVSHEAITVDFDPAIEATEFILEPKVNIETLKKHLNGKIRINLTHPHYDRVDITYSAKPLFKVSPPLLLIQNAIHGKPVVKILSVKSNYNERFEIESIFSSKQCMKVLSQQRNANSIKLEVEIIPPPQNDKSIHFTDDLKIKIINSDELTVRCSGWYAIKSGKQKDTTINALKKSNLEMAK